MWARPLGSNDVSADRSRSYVLALAPLQSALEVGAAPRTQGRRRAAAPRSAHGHCRHGRHADDYEDRHEASVGEARQHANAGQAVLDSGRGGNRVTGLRKGSARGAAEGASAELLTAHG